MAPFDIQPKIYSLLICSQVERDLITGGWRLAPISHLAVRNLPVPLEMVLCANVMGPPGDYELMFRIFHALDTERTMLTRPTNISVHPGKNLEFKAHVSVSMKTAGLYVVEAVLKDYDVAYSPIRISTADDLGGA